MITMVLHDPRLPTEYWDRCAAELERQGISGYQVHFPVPCPGEWTVQRCINASHKNLVALAKFHNLDEVCIMESDVWFPAVDGWEYFLKNKPQLYDIYLAGTYDGCGEPTPTDGIRGLIRPNGFHCYIIHQRHYDRFLSVNDDAHIDDAQPVGRIYKVCFPFAALQHPGWSANAKKDVDYNGDLYKNHKNYVYGW